MTGNSRKPFFNKSTRQDNISFKMTATKKVATISAGLPAYLKQMTSRH